MRTKNLVLALLAGVALAPCAYAQMSKHDQSIASYNYNIAIDEDDMPKGSKPLNQELDEGIISEDGAPTAALPPQMPAQGQAQAPLTPYQNIEPAAPGPATQMVAPIAAAPTQLMIAPSQAIQVGAQVPEFSLPLANGTVVNLKDALAKGPVVVLFTRGSSCGFCVSQMQLLQKNQPQFAALGIQTIAVTPEAPDSVARAQQRFGFTYPVVSDLNSQVAKTYGLTATNSAAATAPAIITINTSGKIVDVQTQQPGVKAFNLTQATNPLRTQASIAPVAVPTSPATAVPSTQVAPQQPTPNAMPPVPSPQAGKVSYDVPPSSPDFGKFDKSNSIAI